MFMPHGFTYGGHPVSAAVALKNIEIIEQENLLENVRSNEGYFGEQLRTLLDLDIVGDVRGMGYFWGVELVRNKKDVDDIFTVEEVYDKTYVEIFLAKMISCDVLFYCDSLIS